MKIFNIRLITWIKHPFMAWEALGHRKAGVVDLDNPENNCIFCGFDHHATQRAELEELYSKFTLGCPMCDLIEKKKHNKPEDAA